MDSKVAELLYEYFTQTLSSASGAENSSAMNDLRDDMEIETIFSELRYEQRDTSWKLFY